MKDVKGAEMKKKDCKGCLTLDEHTDNCIWYNKDLIYPCSICLIKVVCVTYCNPMVEYIDNLNKPFKVFIAKKQEVLNG